MGGLLLNCRCGGKYNPRIRWAYGHYQGTSVTFVASGLIPAGHCPVCRRPPISTEAA